MKVLTVVGARPQFVKAAPVGRALAHAGVENVLVHTGQHFDWELSGLFFEELGLPPPDHHLGITAAEHGEMTGRMLISLERTISQEDPTWVLVFGDTNSTLAGGLAAAKLPTRLCHVEAGLRSFNRNMAEEINRVLVDHVSDLCLVPSSVARANLEREGIPGERIVYTGDVMFDAVLLFADVADKRASIGHELELIPGGYVLATVHRAENTDNPVRLRAIVEGLASVAARGVKVVLPLHPRTKKALAGEAIPLNGVNVVPPIGYLDMLWLERHARLVCTDSGGVQKEAFFFRRPCVTLREETEWTELVALDWNRLVPPLSAEAVTDGIIEAMSAPNGRESHPYGDGNAAQLVVDALLRAR